MLTNPSWAWGFRIKTWDLQCRRHRFDPWVGRNPWRRENSLQYSCLENSTDRGAWQATVHGVTESDRRVVHLLSYV